MNRKGNRYNTDVYRYNSPTRKKSSRGKHTNPTQVRKLNKKKVFLVIAIPLLIIYMINRKSTSSNEEIETANNTQNDVVTTSTKPEEGDNTSTGDDTKVEITDWNLVLVNIDNVLPEDFEVELADIDSTRQFDARAIKYLQEMINDMRKAGNTDIWVQSAYRSVARQKELFEESVNKYLKQGKTQEEAEELTLEYINKPGTSEHNLGLAVDFNYVDNSFADTSEYKWLIENAENYGFILRYPKDKEDITKIEYESWHWRYVGKEHAKRINELGMCLEEYIEYLENGNT